MLNQEKVFEELVKHGVTFFTGVPDSYLNGFCNYALDNCGNRNIITANEGNAPQGIISQAKRFLLSICRTVGWGMR